MNAAHLQETQSGVFMVESEKAEKNYFVFEYRSVYVPTVTKEPYDGMFVPQIIKVICDELKKTSGWVRVTDYDNVKKCAEEIAYEMVPSRICFWCATTGTPLGLLNISNLLKILRYCCLYC